eukprot:3367307-Amphidinium_carterae.1
MPMPAMSSGGLLSNSPLGLPPSILREAAELEKSHRAEKDAELTRIFQNTPPEVTADATMDVPSQDLLDADGVDPMDVTGDGALDFQMVVYADAHVNGLAVTPRPDQKETQMTPPPSPLKLKEEISQQDDFQQRVFGVIDLIDDDAATD